MKIGIVTPTLVEWDAVGNDVVGMYHCIKDRHDVRLYAENFDVPHPVSHISKMSGLDLYIYHHSVYCEPGVQAFREMDCRKVLKYHNITPPEFFPDGSEARIACLRGRLQLHELLAQDCAVWADSEYNGEELREIRDVPYAVIPPYNQFNWLMSIRPDYDFVRGVKSVGDWNTNILVVGRVAPNKNILGAVEGFAEYRRRNRHSRLIVTGDAAGPYGDAVRQRCLDLGLGDSVVLVGKVPLNLLKTLYLTADALLIASKHEGFCVPMVEAMGMGLPVVSSRHGALPYTGGDAVVYVDDDDPRSVAGGLEEGINNRPKYSRLGNQRFQERFINSRIDEMILTQDIWSRSSAHSRH